MTGIMGKDMVKDSLLLMMNSLNFQQTTEIKFPDLPIPEPASKNGHKNNLHVMGERGLK